MSESPLAPAVGTRRDTLVCMAGAVLLLFVTAVGYRFMHPEMMAPVPLRAAHGHAEAPSQETQDRIKAELAALMQRIQANPGDVPALIKLSEYCLRFEDWATAEKFARRAVNAVPNDSKPHYLLSVALHGLDRHQEAAESLEHALALKEDPALRYSLGMLYGHYLNDKAKAVENLRKGLADPAASEAMKADFQEELQKLEP